MLDDIIFRSRPGALMQQPETPLLRKLQQGGATRNGLIEEAGPESAAIVSYWLTRLARAGLLEYLLPLSDGTFAHLRAHRNDFAIRKDSFDSQRRYALSPFAFLRRDKDVISLESPLSGAIVTFESWLPAAVISQFRKAVFPDLRDSDLPQPFHRDALRLSELLWRAGFLENDSGQSTSAQNLWEFHDLLFHQRSSAARLHEPFGRVEPSRFVSDTQLIIEARIELKRPDPDRLQQDPPFSQVMENRRSALVPGAIPIGVEQVAELLWRIAHPQSERFRPLPSAGGLHESEFYLAVHNCSGLGEGLYNYIPADHYLNRIPSSVETSSEIIRKAAACWAQGKHQPHVVMIVAARFHLDASHYASIAYRNALLDAGIALEAIYLASTAMGLACCALGLNIPDLFARATGLNIAEQIPMALMAISSGQPSQAGSQSVDPSGKGRKAE